MPAETAKLPTEEQRLCNAVFNLLWQLHSEHLYKAHLTYHTAQGKDFNAMSNRHAVFVRHATLQSSNCLSLAATIPAGRSAYLYG